MIFFLTTHRHSYTLGQYLDSFGGRLRGRFQQLSYGELFRSEFLPAGTYVFADLERLCPRNLSLAGHVWKSLAASKRCRLLNDPAQTLRRYDLLQSLHEHGLNDFRAYRFTEDLSAVRFPVFLRGEDDHKGGLTPLLGDAAELAASIRRARRSWRLRRANLVTEFYDTADAGGLYRKYSAFCVGQCVVARHVFFSRRWMIKMPNLLEPLLLDEERRYVAENPHRDQLAAIFAVAGVDYGRIDYAIHAGRIQTWEINTNPMIMTADDRRCEPRVPMQERFAGALEEAFAALDDERRGASPPIRVEPPDRRRITKWRSVRERIWHARYV
ncbi:MAG: hypothetical protein WED27_04605 [Pirellulales bacterium]